MRGGGLRRHFSQHTFDNEDLASILAQSGNSGYTLDTRLVNVTIYKVLIYNKCSVRSKLIGLTALNFACHLYTTIYEGRM